jgi:oxygen-dependent protoporphyrinogen oxidase
MRIAIIGGGIAGLATARRLEMVLPEAEIVLLERSHRLGGKLLTERMDGYVVEGAADSFLARKPRGVELCEELGLAGDVIGRRPENARSFVRRGEELLPLPEGLTGLVPTDLDALAGSALLSDEGRERLALESELSPAPPGNDESIASFITRRLGREAYEAFVEPLLTGIFAGDGDRLSLQATFPQLRALELEHGSLLRGLRAQPRSRSADPVFVSLRGGVETLPRALAHELARTKVRTATAARAARRRPEGYAVELEGDVVRADGVVVAAPAFAAAELLSSIDAELAASLDAIPYASSAVITLGYSAADVGHPLDGYGYVVPRSEGSDVLACSWSSSKWDGRAPQGAVLLRVYAGRHGGRDVTEEDDAALVRLARHEVSLLGIAAQPFLERVHRWPLGMPQYVLGHPERLERIEDALERHPGLRLAGAAHRGVGIPDCIASGERAAETIARSLAGVAG